MSEPRTVDEILKSIADKLARSLAADLEREADEAFRWLKSRAESRKSTESADDPVIVEGP